MIAQHRDDRGSRRLVVKFAGRFTPLLNPHHYIGDGERPLLAELVHIVLAVLGAKRLTPCIGQNSDEDSAQFRLVVNDQDLCHGIHPLAPLLGAKHPLKRT